MVGGGVVSFEKARRVDGGSEGKRIAVALICLVYDAGGIHPRLVVFVLVMIAVSEHIERSGILSRIAETALRLCFVRVLCTKRGARLDVLGVKGRTTGLSM